MIPPFLKFRKVGNSDGLFENLGATNGGELKINPWISRSSSSMVSLKKIINWKLLIHSDLYFYIPALKDNYAVMVVIDLQRIGKPGTFCK